MTFLLTQFDNSSNIAARLQGKTLNFSQKTYSLSELKEVDKKEATLLENFLKIFYPDNYQDDKFTPILVTAKNGTLERVYGPILCQKDGKLVLSCGLVEVPLGNKGSKIAYEGLEIEVDVISTVFNGYDKTNVLNVTVFKPGASEEEEGLTFSYNVAIKVRKLEEDEKLPDTKELSTYLKRSPSKLASWLGNPPKPSLAAIAAKQLPEGSYKAVDYKIITKKSDGKQMILLTIEGKKDENDLLTQAYIDPEDDSRETLLPLDKINVFLSDKYLPTLNLQPEVSEEKPAEYTIFKVTKRTNKDGSIKGYSVKDGLSFHEDSKYLVDMQETSADEDLDLLTI